MNLEEKVDAILSYQKRLQRLTLFRGVMNVLFFIALVVLPLVGLAYFFNGIRDELGLDLDDMRQVLEGLKTIGKTGDSIGSLLGGLKGGQ